MGPLRPFLTARLDEAQAAGSDDPDVLAAHRRILDAWHASRSPIHRAGLDAAVKAMAGIWAQHPDYDPTWPGVSPQARRAVELAGDVRLAARRGAPMPDMSQGQRQSPMSLADRGTPRLIDAGAIVPAARWAVRLARRT